MKILVIYDSYFGNTESIALAIKDSILENKQVVVKKISDFNSSDLEGVEVIIIGSPTRAFRPTGDINNFFKKIDIDKYKWLAFDTGVNPQEIKSKVLTILVKLFGCAAPNMAKTIKKSGGVMLANPETFYVVGNEGPLVTGEIDRSRQWIESVKI